MRQNVITHYGNFITNYEKKLIKHYDKNRYKLQHLYDKLRQKVITNYGKKVLQITSEIYYKLRQLKFLQIIYDYYKLQQFSMLLQTTSKTITT